MLIVEWSAPRYCRIEDRAAWRLASPHWSARAGAMIAHAGARALSGFASEDPDEPDPIEAVRAQWLNIWPIKLAASWPSARSSSTWSGGRAGAPASRATAGRLWVAVEDDYGRGGAVAAVADLGDGLLEVDGWLSVDRDAALVEARALIDARLRCRVR